MLKHLWGVSNADFHTPWPKLQRLCSGLTETLHHHPAQHGLSPAWEAAAWPLLADAEVAADGVLPHTGVSIERERALSPTFIHTSDYGTRASTLLVHGRTHVTVVERTFTAQGMSGEARFSLNNIQVAA